MSPNPFFSGRIPQELYDRAEEYISKTGKPRTQVLIEALATYLDFPTDSFKTFRVEVSRSEFEALDRRIKELELLVKPSEAQPEIADNNSYQTDNTKEDDNNTKLKDISLTFSLSGSPPVSELNINDLASRLNVSPSTISSTKSRHKKDTNKFSLWLQEKDPDGIRWEYREKTKMYHPVIS